MGQAAKASFGKVLLIVSGVAVSMREATKPLLFEVVKVSKFEEVSHEMVVFRLRHVSFRVACMIVQ